MRIWMFKFIVLWGLVFFSSIIFYPSVTLADNNSLDNQLDSIPIYQYKVLKSRPHDQTASTQGLLFKNGLLYESTGQNGFSGLRIVDIKTGKTKVKVNLSSEYYGEGISILNNKVFLLTWLNQKGFVYEEKKLKLLGEFKYQGEGWGLTSDGHSLIMSNGTHTLNFINPKNFTITKSINVYNHGAPLLYLNELEYIKGEIYANILYSSRIVRINPDSGNIVGWIDLKALQPDEVKGNEEADFNGIAYNPANDSLFVTGKLWPKLFEIKLENN